MGFFCAHLSADYHWGDKWLIKGCGGVAGMEGRWKASGGEVITCSWWKREGISNGEGREKVLVGC